MSTTASAPTNLVLPGARGTGAAPAGRLASSTPLRLAALVVVWLASALYVFQHLPMNWPPSDEGMLAQSAEHVLRGETPLRDFAEVYTGGLSHLHAVGFTCWPCSSSTPSRCGTWASSCTRG